MASVFVIEGSGKDLLPPRRGRRSQRNQVEVEAVVASQRRREGME